MWTVEYHTMAPPDSVPNVLSTPMAPCSHRPGGIWKTGAAHRFGIRQANIPNNPRTAFLNKRDIFICAAGSAGLNLLAAYNLAPPSAGLTLL